MNLRPTAIDLFSGCGGLTLGLKQAGFKVIGAVEIDSLSIETYRTNHPEVTIWEQDIRKLTTIEVRKQLHLRKGELDLLAGCPPCQGFSSLRTLNGNRVVKDSRNNLILDFLRFIENLKPKAVMMENVPGIIENKRFKDFCRKLGALGYTLEYRVLDAANYGVPQRRRRMILLASRFGNIAFASPLRRRKTVKETIAGLPSPGHSGDSLHDFQEHRSRRISALIKMIPKDGGSRTALGEEYQLECHKRRKGFNDIYGRMAWNNVAPTITGGCTNPSKGRFLHPEEDRAITLREAALLQSFPQRYYFSLKHGKGAVSAMIGNALPPKFISHHARVIRKYLEKNNRGLQ